MIEVHVTKITCTVCWKLIMKNMNKNNFQWKQGKTIFFFVNLGFQIFLYLSFSLFIFDMEYTSRASLLTYEPFFLSPKLEL